MPNVFEERVYVNKANEFLGNIWTNIEDRETPDFKVIRENLEVGIEVTNIYTSHDSRKGSPDKKRESDGYKKLGELPEQYNREGRSPIIVKVRGCNPSDETNSLVLSCLLNHTPIKDWEQSEYDLAGGIKVYVTDLPDSESVCRNYNRWFLPDNHTGSPRKVTAEEIQQVVNKKGEKLQAYNKAFASVDLLIVANRTRKSGMLLPPEPVEIVNPGFANIYFLSYPESITCLTRESTLAI